jgi:hypothetical protein
VNLAPIFILVFTADAMIRALFMFDFDNIYGKPEYLIPEVVQECMTFAMLIVSTG